MPGTGIDRSQAGPPVADRIKADINSGRASLTTITLLQDLLGLPGTSPNPLETGQATLKTRNSRAVRDGSTAAASATARVAARKNEPASTTLTQRRRIATEIAILGSSVLAETSPATRKQAKKETSDGSPRPPLQPRSGNTTPSPAKQGTVEAKMEADAAPSERESATSSRSVAQCTHLALSCLRDTTTSGTHKHLLEGSLAFCRHLIAHGLTKLAFIELEACRTLLRGQETATETSRSTRSSKCLLDIGDRQPSPPEHTRLAVVYQTLVLKAIASKHDPSMIEDLATYLTDAIYGPDEIVASYNRSTHQSDKAAIYLESLASEILTLCPKLSTSADNVALDHSNHADPIAVFKLQTYALHLRRTWWAIAKHQVDAKHSLSTQFAKVLRACIRRTATKIDPLRIYQTAVVGYELVFNQAQARVDPDHEVLSTLKTLAAEARSEVGVQRWAQCLRVSCDALDDADCRKLAIMATKSCLSGEHADLEAIEALAKHLGGKLQGQPEHYSLLLAELALLLQKQTRTQRITSSSAYSKFVCNATKLSCWVATAYPGSEPTTQQSIISSALRSCPRTQLVAWLDHRALLAFTRDGVVKRLRQTASSTSLRCAYRSSAKLMALGELINVLVLKELKEGTVNARHLALESLEEAVILEWKLTACLKFGTTSSTRAVSQNMFRDALKRLDKIYDASEHPLRRALVSIQVAVAASKDIVSQDDVKIWDCSVKLDSLGQDADLASYVPDITACLDAIAFVGRVDRSPSLIRTALDLWHTILHDPANTSNVDHVIYDKTMLVALLETLCALCEALGWQEECLKAYRLQATLLQLAGECPTSALIGVSECHLALHQPVQALNLAEEALSLLKHNVQSLDRLRGLLTIAEAHFCTQNLVESRSALYAANMTYTIVSCQSGNDRKQMAMTCAKAWWLHSRLCLHEGELLQAIKAARLATSVINSVWAQLEHKDIKTTESRKAHEVEEADETGVEQRVSKLTLTTGRKEVPTHHGPNFWRIIPIACEIFIHASQVYIHAGLFTEAHLHATRAVALADAVTDSTWTVTARAHLANTFTLAGRIEDAELCLAKLDHKKLVESHLSAVDLYRAQARICAKTNEAQQALKHYSTACRLITEISAKSCSNARIGLTETAPVLPLARPTRPKRTTKTHAALPKTAQISGRGSNNSGNASYLRMLADIKLESAHVQHRLTGACESIVPAVDICNSTARQLQNLHAMSRFEKRAETDVVFNSLVESSLLCPGIQGCGKKSSVCSDRTLATGTTKKPIKAPANKKKVLSSPSRTADLSGMLRDTQTCLRQPAMTLHQDAIHDLHKETRMIVTSSMFSLATNLSQQHEPSTEDVSASISLPAVIANVREKIALSADISNSKSTPVSWPSEEYMKTSAASHAVQSLDVSEILPPSWTVVSLHLDADATELVAMQQRHDEASSFVRLPFARQDLEAERVETFDFDAGCSELKMIIERSDSICHAGNQSSKKMASSTWWKERETLDRRLHELLINIEEIWLGGFKGILCPLRKSRPELSRFRKDFETILARHLPVIKGSQRTSLSDTTLQLFLDLCYGQGSILDVDAAVLDLLYSVVDTLRFHGRELAYDEIDFDALTVETIDVLQGYHDNAASAEDDHHLILVLDKRLQSFPWESLPYLENTSVSRMADMLSLRERIVSMRLQDAGRYRISRQLGSVVLDPAADMKRTQETMQPVLQTLRCQRPGWQSIIGRPPQEDELHSALTTSSIVLYFGHGSGSQYIRPRTVKKMDSCSEVVWLMGCSSGMVTEHGELEPTSVPAAYLLAGKTSESGGQQCFAVLANLWDVTDKDIDRFSIAAGQDWGLWSLPADETKQSVKGGRRATRKEAPSTPPLSPKTPQMQTIPRIDAASKTPRRDRSSDARCGTLSLSEAVSRSRDACYLRYLNGAAPVVYGVPVYLGDQ